MLIKTKFNIGDEVYLDENFPYHDKVFTDNHKIRGISIGKYRISEIFLRVDENNKPCVNYMLGDRFGNCCRRSETHLSFSKDALEAKAKKAYVKLLLRYKKGLEKSLKKKDLSKGYIEYFQNLLNNVNEYYNKI